MIYIPAHDYVICELITEGRVAKDSPQQSLSTRSLNQAAPYHPHLPTRYGMEGNINQVSGNCTDLKDRLHLSDRSVFESGSDFNKFSLTLENRVSCAQYIIPSTSRRLFSLYPDSPSRRSTAPGELEASVDAITPILRSSPNEKLTHDK